MSKDIITKIQLSDGEVLHQEVKKKPTIPMPFHKYGLKGYTMGMDAVKMITEMTKPEADVFIKLRDNVLVETNETYISTAGLKRSQQISQRKAINKLKDKNIIKEINRKEYIFNPEFLVPNGNVFEKIKLLYQSMK